MSGTLPLAGKLALVTGAAKRLGRHLALCLAREGADIIVHYRSSQDAAASLVHEIEQLGREAHLLRADLAHSEGAELLVQSITERWDCLDIMINNVGIYPRTPLLDSSAKEWRQTLDVNLVAPHILIAGLRPLLAARRGVVINMGDARISGLRARTHATAYHVSKVGLLTLTKSYALALAEEGIRVNMISPGQLENSVDLPPDPRKAIPLGRPGALEDIAVVVRMLVRPDSYITGANIDVAGGYQL